MRILPLADPGTPDVRSPGRLLWWLARGQWPTLLGAMAFGIVWMLAQAVMPALVGKAIDEGVTARDASALAAWAGALAAVGLVQTGAGVMRHRFSVTNWLTAAYRVVQLVTRRATHVGAGLPQRVATGEVVSVGSSDLPNFGNVMDVAGRAAGAVVSFVVVAAILLHTSQTLGLVVLIGVPVLLFAIGPLLRPLQVRTLSQREMTGRLNSQATDIVGGLRVLRGIGGEDVFHDQYARESQRVRAAGVRVGRMQALLDALQILLPGVLVVLVVWLGARLAVAGAISPGELVAFYGYAAFLVVPLRTATEFANKLIRALVAARRFCSVWAVEPAITDPAGPMPLPPAGALFDRESGLVVTPGLLTAVVAAAPDHAARIADRLGRYVDGDVTYGGVPLDAATRTQVRRRILVSDASSTVFSGPLRHAVDPWGTADEPTLADALTAASGDDVLESLPQGWDTVVEERGRSLSGGQRQRVVLARALVADPDVLVLVEPTSAVDAHTEARIAATLAERRRGRTTVVTTSSPLLLDRVDEVALVVDGRVVATGTHHDLLRTDARYRHAVTRDDEAAELEGVG
ncbi:MAG: yheI 1 [Nocardioidaceae bacterium]|jgi:ABC-type multidrug transport system fused ATPase/permease subunit|nr:yheI 1 [Nocardioidaceae bacterium]